MTIDITTNSANETVEFGRKFGSQLRGGEVIALVGSLGAGKTHLIKESLVVLAQKTQQMKSPAQHLFL